MNLWRLTVQTTRSAKDVQSELQLSITDGIRTVAIFPTIADTDNLRLARDL